jgi:hypothetical protein
MKTLAIAIMVAALAMILTGCAGSPMRVGNETPAELARESGYNLCRAALSRHSNQAIESEISARRLDCGPYAASIAQREAAADAALNNFANSMQRNRPVTTYCNPIGNGMNCRSY